MARTRVVINRAEFGRQVTAAPSMGVHLAGIAGQIASEVGGTVELVTEPAAGGGARTRARVSNGTSDREEADTNTLTSALASRLPLS